MNTSPLPREPETVVLAFFAGNDLGDSRRFVEYENEGRTFSARVHEGKQPLGLLGSVSTSSVHRELASVKTVCVLSLSADRGYRATDAGCVLRRVLNPHWASDAETIRASVDYSLTRTSIEEMAESQHSRGAEFVLMYIPQKAELYWRFLSDDGRAEIVRSVGRNPKYRGLEAIDRNIGAQREVMRTMASEIGIPFLDLTPALLAAIRDGQVPWFFADTHWNQVGHNIARIALLDFLNQTNLES